jgi:adenylate kinase family enzyme
VRTLLVRRSGEIDTPIRLTGTAVIGSEDLSPHATANTNTTATMTPAGNTTTSVAPTNRRQHRRQAHSPVDSVLSYGVSDIARGPAGSSGTLAVMSGSRLAIGRRVVVTGLAGSGKSTFAVALAAETGLPVIHLDLCFWKPGWVAPSESEWREKQRVALNGDAWIADGNYHETLDLRLERADTLVVLDLPWWLCSGRALLRGFRMPGELPEGCHYSAWTRWRDEWRLAGRIWRKRHSEPEREREVTSQHGQHVAVHVLRSRRAVSDFLDGLDADRAIVNDG